MSDNLTFDHPDEADESREAFVRRLAPTEAGCWEWTGYRRELGYGELRFAGVNFRAHRFSWLLFRGEIPDGLWVLHRCDNPPCCNPSHLFLGDALANTRDMIAKGRDNNLPQRKRAWERLRGKTHCPAGHPYAGDNLVLRRRSDGYTGRRCRTCHAEQERARREAA